jgi:predicted transcriptional regulator
MTYHDVTKITSGEVAWRNRMRWVKNSMVKEGLLSSGNKRGTWKITKEGTKALKHWTGI